MYISDTTKKELIRFQEAMAKGMASWAEESKELFEDVVDYYGTMEWVLYFILETGSIIDGKCWNSQVLQRCHDFGKVGTTGEQDSELFHG